MTKNIFLHKQKLFAIITVLISVWVIWSLYLQAGTAFYTDAARRDRSAEQATRALEFDPDSPEALLERALIFEENGRLEPAIADLERSVEKGPSDYFAWLRLGLARQKKGDLEGARTALAESVRLAPDYGLPHWYLGTLLRKTGDEEQGWAQIRLSFIDNSNLLLAALKLAWVETRGDAVGMQERLRFDSEPHKLIFGLYLLDKGATLDAARFLCASPSLTAGQRETLMQRLNKRQDYRLARMIGTGNCEDSQDFAGQISNPGFEEEIAYGRGGISWQISPARGNLAVTTDRAQFFEGKRSLRIDFKGNVAPAQLDLQQLVLVEPNTRYRLSFAVKAKEVVTDSAPFVAVREAATGKELGVSKAFPKSVENWSKMEVDFVTGPGVEAILIQLGREKCIYRACPIFGTIWLDDLQLQ